MEWLVNGVNICRIPWQSGTCCYGSDFGCFFANSGRFCNRGVTLWCRNPLLSPNKIAWGHLMKMEWLMTHVTAVRTPDRAECAIFRWFWLSVFWSFQAVFVIRGALCDVSRIPFLSPNNFFQCHLMKVKWLVVDVTADESSDRAEHAILRVISEIEKS